jgi:glycosyltransferase involved in cell wall biosynthesis
MCYARGVSRPSTPPLRVLARPAWSSLKHNPYTSLVYGEVERRGIAIVEYRPYLPWIDRFDVVHVHWPESVFDHTLAEAIPTTESLYWGAREAKRRGAKLLWTVHNLSTHEHRHPQFERRFMDRFVAILDGIVVLTRAGQAAACERFPALRSLPAWRVPHPHYRGQYPDTIDRAEARRRLAIDERSRVLLTFGRMYEYKDVPALIRAVRTSPDEDWVVLVVGRPRTAAVGETLRAEGAGDPRIRYHLTHVDAADVQLFFRAADLVVQPYREILNSGTALLALSFDRPVLLPNHGSGVDLASSFGLPWVHTYDGDLTGDVLRSALRIASSLPERTDGAHLRSLDVREVGAAMADALTACARSPRG